MSTEAFRRHGKAMIDWIADYYESVDRYTVLARARMSSPPRNLEVSLCPASLEIEMGTS